MMNFRCLIFVPLFLLISACSNDDSSPSDLALVAIPQTITISDLRSSIEIESPKTIDKAGKIYAYQKFIFVVDTNKGIHVIDNANPMAPIKHSFINIPGVRDLSIKSNILYADSAVDLVVFDISDINSIQLVERLENVFNVYDFNIPEDAEFVDYESFNFENDIVIGWDLQMRDRRPYEDRFITFEVALSSSDVATVGKGGSLARFQIVDTYLYTVGRYEMNIFNIENLSIPIAESTQYTGWDIETMFESDGYLYLGGTNGMYIYDLTIANSPTFISEFSHWEGCDPVVVDGNYAYLTLRGGNACGQLESVLEVIDVSDKSNPTLIDAFSMESPYGLGFRGDDLFICDGEAGIKIFDKTDPENLVFKNSYPTMVAKDIIALENTLIVMSDAKIYQYQYADESLVLLSEFQVN